MVGDSPQDMKMAMAAGLGARVAVLTGTAGPELLAPLADVVLQDIGELPGWLKGWG
jgi:phosphoglycolate phosphatase